MNTKEIQSSSVKDLLSIGKALTSKNTQSFITEVIKYAGIFMQEINELAKNNDAVTIATLKALNDRLLTLCELEKNPNLELSSEEKERNYKELVEIKAQICDIQKKSSQDKWKPVKYGTVALTVYGVSKLVIEHAPDIIKFFKKN